MLPASLMRLLGEAIEIGSQLTGRASLLGRQKVREVASAHWICRTDAITEVTGWRATFGLEAGFAETVAWYRDNRAWWEPLKAQTAPAR